MPSPGTGRRIEVILPEGQTRLLLRVVLGDDWAGDLLFASADERNAFLDALTAGEISVVQRQIPLTNAYPHLEAAAAVGTARGRNR